jgi:thiol-disulfide isomerase/thioredoxin
MPAQAEIQITASANAMDRLQAEPQSITILRPSPAESKKKITLTNHGDQPVHLTRANCDDSRVTVDALEVEAGRKYEITLTLPAGYQPPAPGATVRLQTDDPNQPAVEVGLRGTPRPPTPAEMLAGRPAPEVEFDTAEGAHVSTVTPDGPLVLVFYASGCPHSKRTLPVLEALRKSQEQRGVRFVAVNMDPRPGAAPPESPAAGPMPLTREQSLAGLRELGVGMDVCFDDEREFGKSQFKITSFPTLVVIAPDGAIAKVHVGALAEQSSASPRGAWSVQDLEELLDRVREQ